MTHRHERVAEEIKHKLNSAMSKDLSELNLGIVTISKVLLTNDLKLDKCVDRLNYRKSHIRFLLAKQLKLRYMPELTFYYDDTLDYAEKINKLLNEIKKEESPEKIQEKKEEDGI